MPEQDPVKIAAMDEYDASRDVDQLYQAVTEGNYSAVKALLEKGVDPYILNNRRAARLQATKVANQLLSIGDELLINLKYVMDEKKPFKGKSLAKYKDHYQQQFELYQNYQKILKLLPRTSSQAWLIERIHTIDPSIDKKGICFGVASMSVQAMIAGDLVTFQNRLDAIAKIPVGKFAKKVQEIKDKRIAAYRKAKSKYGDVANLQQLVDDIIKNEWSKTDYDLRDIEAFMYGVKIYQQSENHPLFTKKKNPGQLLAAEETLKLIAPIAMENIDNFSSFYTKEELVKHFSSFKNTLLIEQFNYPLPMRLSNQGHAIMVAYDSKNSAWLLVDANQMPTTRVYRNDTHLTEAVIRALGSEDNATIATNIFVAKANKANAEASIAKWKSSQEWFQTHEVTKERAKMKDARGKSWLNVSYSGGEVEVSKKLMAIKEDDGNAKISKKWLKRLGVGAYSALLLGVFIGCTALIFATGGIGLGVFVAIAIGSIAIAAAFLFFIRKWKKNCSEIL